MKKLVLSLIIAGAGLLATEWQPEIRLTNNNYSDYSYWSTQRRIVVDPAGRIHVAWYVMNSGLGTYRFQIYYKRWEPGSGWTPDTMISADLYNQNLNSKHVSLACDSAGRIYAVWTSGPDDVTDDYIYLKTWSPESGWDQNSRLLSVSAPTVTKECATVTVTPDQHVHVVWLEGTAIVHREKVDTLWRLPVVIEGGSNYKAYPAVAGGPDNRVHVIWYGREGTSGYYDVFYKVRTDTVWGPTEDVSQGERHQMYPSIAVSPVTGCPHVLWQCYGAQDLVRRIVHRWRNQSGWQPADTVSGFGDTLDQEPGQIIATLDGRVHAIWSGRTAGSPVIPQIRYAERSTNGVWCPPVNVTDTVNTRERPSIASGNAEVPGNVYAVWTDYRDGNAEIYYAWATPAQGWEESSVDPESEKCRATLVRKGFESCVEVGPGVLFDITGSRVGRLEPGRNGVPQLTPGVYFLFSDRVSKQAVHRLVVVR
ncbi:MAG: hypothetical protein N2248_00225 [candidate division WOR-3 bacterium]|uniref:Exo-alpha-sialidase n=1 Tax=candidate division WOR-3 bacterium TaxID=2052148 RepID=A0A7C3F0U2_UNCW3|nr:hypothetical protein [candidate division WOR-3 bacterium]